MTPTKIKDINPGAGLFIYPIPKENRLERLAAFLDIEHQKLLQLKQQFGFLSAVREIQTKPDFLTEEELQKVQTFLQLVGEFSMPEILPVEPNIVSVVQYAASMLIHKDFETLAVVPFLEITPYAVEIIGRGSSDKVFVTISDVFRTAVRYNADSILLVHNHPDGQLIPSEADIELTQNVVEAGKVLGITVMDSVVVTGIGWYSIALSGLVEGLAIEYEGEVPETAPIILGDMVNPVEDGVIAVYGMEEEDEPDE